MKLITYTNPVLVKSYGGVAAKDCIVDELFVPHMDRLCGYALQCKFGLFVNSSARYSTDVKGAIVIPAEMSNHLVAHATDANIIDSNGKMWNSHELLDNEGKLSLPPILLPFIELIRKDEVLRYGGDFKKPDVVHFDDGLNIRNPALWQQLFKAQPQNRCLS